MKNKKNIEKLEESKEEEKFNEKDHVESHKDYIQKSMKFNNTNLISNYEYEGIVYSYIFLEIVSKKSFETGKRVYSIYGRISKEKFQYDYLGLVDCDLSINSIKSQVLSFLELGNIQYKKIQNQFKEKNAIKLI